MKTRNENRLGYKKSNVGWIPEDWECVRLRDVASIITGTTPSTKNPKYYGAEFLFIGPGDLDNCKYVTNSKKKADERRF